MHSIDIGNTYLAYLKKANLRMSFLCPLIHEVRCIGVMYVSISDLLLLVNRIEKFFDRRM